MGRKTKIEWTEATWNPLAGCSKTSPGCANCYAEAMTNRLVGMAARNKNPETHQKYARTMKYPNKWSGKIARFPERLEQPLHWQKPRLVFVCSLSDLFHSRVPDGFIREVFRVMLQARQHTFQVLTKRPKRMRALLEKWYAPEVVTSPPENVWLGVSVEDQKRANERIPELLQTPAAVRFVSAEPLLGLIDWWECGSLGPEMGDPVAFSALTGFDGSDPPIPGIDWVIVGGESGPNARDCDHSWVYAIINDCRAAKVPCFVKQLGKRFRTGAGSIMPDGKRLYTVNDYLWAEHPKGGNPEEWPTFYRVREWPKT
jgi:protein gp37